MGAVAATDAAPAAAQTWSDEGAGAPGGHSTIESSCQTIGSHSDVTEDVPLDVAENCLGRMRRLVPFLALIAHSGENVHAFRRKVITRSG
jgi:hypothetical protein